MSIQNELGISPVLLQAIAQTLKSSSFTSALHNTPSTAVVKDNKSSFESQSDGKNKVVSMSLKGTSASGAVSHILQNLNESVASLISQTSSSSQVLQQLVPDENISFITKSKQSTLTLSEDTALSGNSFLTNPSLKNVTQPSLVISREDITNFLLKDEPSDDSEECLIQQGSQNMNTVSSMLTALASQHIQESLNRNNNKQIQSMSVSQLQEQCLSSSVGIVSTSNATVSVTETYSQPQIIIYSYITPTDHDAVSSPVTSLQRNDTVINESERSSDTPTTYRILVQSPGDTGENKHITFQPNISYTISPDSDDPEKDIHTPDGMNQPCPVCGDKVSGYHYGIFTCESCKGFFKRTVQNKRTFVCPKSSDCRINSFNRKKCPACRFKQCLLMGMKLEAIRRDRTRGGRSSYEGCASHVKNRTSHLEKRMKHTSTRFPLPGESFDQSSLEDDDKSHRNLVAILNHDAHKQTTPNSGALQVPELLRDIMNLEHLLNDDDLPAESLMESPFHEQALYSYMMQLAELRLYKLVRWARNLPQFGAISTDDQILLLQNSWLELITLNLCWRSIDTPSQISISSTHHITADWARHLGFEDVVLRVLSVTDSFRKLYLDQFEFVALKVLLLITPDVKGLKEPWKIRDFQEKLTEAFQAYTISHYPNQQDKFGELLLRLPELSRISFLTKDILIKSLPPSMSSCGLLVELLKGDNKNENDGSDLKF